MPTQNVVSLTKRGTAVFLCAILMTLMLTATACRSKKEPTTPGEGGENTYTWRDAVSTLATNWNPHTYESQTDAYPQPFIRSGLYTFLYNDTLHPVEGKDPYEGYVILPEMAAALPVDVTETIRDQYPQYNIPEGATAGYAYRIDLNPAATWEDGTPINAKTYVSSLKRLLDPRLLNYRATDYYDGEFAIAGARAYAHSGRETKDMESSWAQVGLFESGEYQITLVLEKSLAGFNLLYNLTGNWLVYEPLYDTCIQAVGNTYQSTYHTSVDTTMSYGPYRLTSYQPDKAMHFERNENWYGYHDGHHVFADPITGKEYPMYQTTAIDCTVVAEAETRKLMFLKGQLMTYALGSDDYSTYRSSDHCYPTPGTSTFFLILNGHADSIAAREAAGDFDQNTTDLECLTLRDFRRGIALSYDRELFASAVSPARSGGYGLVGNTYVYDPETMATYRETDAARQALCDFYAVDPAAYDSLETAVSTITGYDVEGARQCFQAAFEEGIRRGYITDRDGDGRSDQTVRIEYCVSADSDFMTTTINYLNSALAPALEGTPFEGKVVFYKSAPYGNQWFNRLKSGLSDTVLGGWSGSALDPFSLTDLYTNPARAYDAGWFNADTVPLTLTIEGKAITLSLRQWSQTLGGTAISVGDQMLNLGTGQAPTETRLAVLAALEKEILSTYHYIPMLQDAAMSLLSQQVYYVTPEYSTVMERGGLAYTRYNYNDADWRAYVAARGGELAY